jgi:stage II sporulation protein AA (anti-sigma F factor antagonist)
LSVTALGSTPGSDLIKIELWGERDALCVAPEGDIDLSTVTAVDGQLQRLRESGARNLVLDLRQVLFMDSFGLRLVLQWSECADAEGFAFAVIQGPPPVARVFELCGVGDRVRLRAV